MNEQYEVVGMRDVDYVNKKGQKVVGRMLYVQYCRDNIRGVGVCDIYVPGAGADDVKIGDVVTPLYNRWRRVQSIVNHGSAYA